jgi:LacI family transcriptional regulator
MSEDARPRSRPSIADVARLADVSISTVSRVVNRSELVNQKTRARVEDAIRKLGYQPNAFARGLMLQRSQIIGLVLPDLHGEFYSEIIRGANTQARENGYSLIVASASAGNPGTTGARFDFLHHESLLDGIAVMVAERDGGAAAALEDWSRPYVVLDDDIPGRTHDSVIIDQAAGAAALVRHLVGTNHIRRMVFVGGPQTNFDTAARLQACRDALAESQLEIDPADVFYLDYQYETAFAMASRNVRSWARPGTCVFAANDEMAAGIVTAATAARIRVPEDLAVVGFDDTRVARMTQPPLTTVRVPMAEMGAKAIELLCQRIAEPDRPSTRVLLEPQLIVRESCGCPGGRNGG